MGADTERQEALVVSLVRAYNDVVAERDMLLALVDDACASDDLTVLRDWQTSRLLKETEQ